MVARGMCIVASVDWFCGVCMVARRACVVVGGQAWLLGGCVW